MTNETEPDAWVLLALVEQHAGEEFISELLA